TGNDKVYFFRGSDYLRFDLLVDHVDAGYPQRTAANWPGLGDLGTAIDAALVAPSGKKVYFFTGMRYSRYDVLADRVDLNYPLDIATNWHGLWGSGLDAAVLWPKNGKIYFFHGSSYSRYDFKHDKVDIGYPFPIVANWRGLEPFSGGIDAVLVTP